MRCLLTILTTLTLFCAMNRSQAQTGPAIDSSAQNEPLSLRTDSSGVFRATMQATPQLRSEQKPDPRLTRGLSSLSNQFVPKGQWIGGISASYSTHTNTDYTFLVINDINSDGYTFKVSPLIAYAIRDNMAVGARFNYSRSMLRVKGADINLGDQETGINLNMEYYYALQHTYSVGLIWRQYIPLGRSKRFALFNETQLALGGGQAEFAMDYPIRGTYQKSFTFSLGVSPGLVAFATNNLAFEVNVGVMGITYNRTRQVHNQVTVGNRSSSMMNFKINIFSVGLGVSFYL